MSSVSTVAIERCRDKTTTTKTTGNKDTCLLNLKRRGEEEAHKDATSITASSHQTFASSSWKEHESLLATNHTEFFDADEEFLSDGSVSNASPSFRPNVEIEMHAARVDLFDEMERAKQAENALARVRSHWQRVKNNLSEIGLSFPAVQDVRKDPELDMDTVQQFCQEIVVARFVSEAIGRGHARAEAEAAAEVMIESKDQEITRLRNKVNYYEAVNHEMSRRNHEVVDAARKTKTKKRWMWTCICLCVSLGTVVTAYSLFPETSQHISSKCFDAPSDMPEPV